MFHAKVIKALTPDDTLKVANVSVLVRDHSAIIPVEKRLQRLAKHIDNGGLGDQPDDRPASRGDLYDSTALERI